VEFCFLCDEYPCKKYDNALDDSFITHQNIFKDAQKAKQIGIEAYIGELNIKIEILEKLLKNHDDGRRKSFFCLAVNLLDIADVNSVMEQLDGKMQLPLKERAKFAAGLFQAVADEKGIVLKLNKPK